MRIGKNPEKDNFNLTCVNYHRIIIPVYIPNFEGYFSDSFEILKICIQSLLLTIHDKTRITIYNNASHLLVKEYIDDLYKKEEYIDQVFHSKENLGKVNAILAVAKGNIEPLITITDADVFFKNNWQFATEKIFINFKEAGMVSPVPTSKGFKTFVNANWYYGFFKGKIRFKKVLDTNALIKFDKSLGNDKPLYKQIHLEKYLVLKNNKDEAVMGCGHFVATLRREVFDKGTNEPAFVKIVGGVENKFIDFPNEKLGFLRLATKENYAYHLGNKLEKWMQDGLNQLVKNKKQALKIEDFLNFKPINKTQLNIGKIINRILMSSYVKSLYFMKLGLNRTESKIY